MMETLVERAWVWIHATFPERQIYIRSDGRVQFFTFSAPLQATLAGLSLLFLGWFAFASVNVIFKDHIITAKNHRYQAMQANYENRIAELQSSYDDLNGALVAAQDNFRSTLNQVVLKQQAIARLISPSTEAASPLNGVAAALLSQPASLPRAQNAGTADDSLILSPGQSSLGSAEGNSELNMLPQTVAPQPTTGSPPTRASFLEGTFQTLAGAAGALFRRKVHPKPISEAVLHNPSIRALAQLSAQAEQLNSSETPLLRTADVQVRSRIASAENVMQRAGLSPNNMIPRGIGGPSMAASDVRIEGIEDPAFTSAYLGASAHGKELAALVEALKQVPLTTPVHGSGFQLTSDFGARVDPFTHRVGFHPGLDFAGPWGSAVAATAPGRVVFAGQRGGYGNMVEIDHGYGIHTRYGHLSSILVSVGAKVSKGSPVGKLGSTGRSTGPHVHYEVWLASALRDPSRFIEAGRHVQ
ncbi:MAG: peptidoglycan DD-metalloendopeptidase family protein [Alphaproteobacteria bacterium]|nr:peptidoglycan DD-metalloendopeptidase family protein [Alphaproteobacteria bacterium]